MSKLTPRFSSDHMMREYAERLYLPAAEAYHRREADGFGLAQELDIWAKRLAENWKNMRFLGTHVFRDGEQWKFEVQVYFGEIDPSMVMVELYADLTGDEVPIEVTMTKADPLSGWLMAISVGPKCLRCVLRPADHYTPRIIPFHPDAFMPLEESHIMGALISDSAENLFRLQHASYLHRNIIIP
jgi:starch phosphorylase